MSEPGQPASVTVPVLVTIARAGELLGRSARTVRRRIADGALPAVIEGDHVMVRADELKTYIESLERPAGPSSGRRRHRPALRNYDCLLS